MKTLMFRAGALIAGTLTFVGCVVSSAPSGRQVPRERPVYSSARQLDSWEAERLRRIMLPLVQSMNSPCRSNEVRVGIIDQAEVNAANAGGCQFYLTTALLRRANESQLRGVMAHEIAHEDLGHVARAQVLGAGLNIGAALLEQFLPGSGLITPLAGTLIARSYSRSEEYAADRHAVEILRRADYPREVMGRARLAKSSIGALRRRLSLHSPGSG